FAAPYCANASLAVSNPEPTKTADGSPRRAAAVSISAVVLRTFPSTWSTRTRTSAMVVTPSLWSGSDELAGGQELGEGLAALALIGHDLTRSPRRTRLDALHRGPGSRQPDLTGIHSQVTQPPGLHRLLLGGHDPL